MSNSFFKRFKREEPEPPVVEEKPPVFQDRIFWVSILQKIAFPVLDNLSRGSLKRNMKLENNTNLAYLEAFAYVFNGIAPWLELGSDETEEGQIRDKYKVLTLKAIKNAVNPHNNDYLFSMEEKESLMHVAFFAQGLLRSKNQIWLNLSIEVQARIIRELKRTRNIAPFENHWLLYTAIIEAALLEFTGECDKQRLTYGINKFKDEFYMGDAIYAQGDEFYTDYYNSLVIHPIINDILIVMRKYGISEGEFLDVQFMRSSRLASQLERVISPEGTYPIVGKSIAYRCGVFHLLSQVVLLKILPKNIKYPQVRSALTAVLKKHFEDDRNFNEDQWLKLGFNGNQPDIVESYINTGSLYACCAIFLPLGLDKNNSFWSDPSCDWTSVKAWNGQPVSKDQSIDF